MFSEPQVKKEEKLGMYILCTDSCLHSIFMMNSKTCLCNFVSWCKYYSKILSLTNFCNKTNIVHILDYLFLGEKKSWEIFIVQKTKTVDWLTSIPQNYYFCCFYLQIQDINISSEKNIAAPPLLFLWGLLSELNISEGCSRQQKHFSREKNQSDSHKSLNLGSCSLAVLGL